MSQPQPTFGDRWITDTQISPRFPYYTRANADEVGPDPFSPLGWSLGWMKGCIPGVAKGFIEFGVLTADEFALDPPEVFGNWGGYFYNQLSVPRLMGCRMPGASPSAIDQAYFGDHPGVPPYVAHPDDENEVQTAKLGARMGWVMSTDSFAEQDAAAVRSRELTAARPDLAAMTNAELVAYGRLIGPIIDDVWVPYCQSCLAASLGPGAVQAVCAAIGRSEAAVTLLSGIGGVDSAEASFAMWDLSRTIRATPSLMSAFDGGVAGALARIEALNTAEANAFLAAWNAVINEHGHRGPNEWDMRAHSWATKNELALGMLERLRHQDDSRSPHEARRRAATERERVGAELLALLDDDPTSRATLEAGLASAKLFFAMRERGKNATIRVIHEGKLAFFELGRRMVAAGVIDNVQDLFMVLESELDSFLAEPASHTATIRTRAAQFQALHELEPPYIVRPEESILPIAQWPRRGRSKQEAAGLGDVLQGAPGAPGTATGTARVVLDPSDPFALEPGDIMIAPTTDPSWTPLFLAVAAVVVNVGAVASHAAIVCRELGVPCAVSVVNATDRIPDGATISVDGATGRVVILALP